MNARAARAGVLLLALAAIGSGCVPSLPGSPSHQATTARAPSPSPKNVPPASLRLLEAEDIQTLDPIYMSDDASLQVGFELYEGLTALTPNNAVVPGLAATWEISSDGTRYTFHLRREARFHSGRPVTAEAVRWSWARALDPALASPLRFLLQPLGVTGAPAALTNVETSDPQTLEVHLPEAASEFLALLAVPPYWVVDREAIEGDPGWAGKATPAGSGPYRISAWERSNRLTFTSTDLASLRPAGISIDIVRDPEVRLRRVREGAADLAHGLAPIRLLEASYDPDAATVAFAPGLRTVWLGFNLERAPARDPRFRQALAHAIDRDRLADLALVGRVLGIPTFGQVPPAIAGQAQLPAYPFDEARARALWADAGRPSPIAIWFADGDVGRRVAQELGAQFRRALDAVVELHPEGGDFFRRRSAGEFAVFLGGWTADYPHWRSFLEPLDLTGAQFNDFGLHDAEVDRLIVQANHALPAAHLSAYEAAERRVLELGALVPLYATQEGFVVQVGLRWPLRPEPWPARWENAQLRDGRR